MAQAPSPACLAGWSEPLVRHTMANWDDDLGGRSTRDFIEENVVMSTLMMSRCDHHILSSSTLSFWGAYLDRKQPTGGRTLLPSEFFVEHGHGMVPYPTWEEMGEGKWTVG